MKKTEVTTFEALSEVIGKEGAINLCEQYGGITLYIRKTAESGPKLKEHWQTFYGKEAQDKLNQHFGGKRCYIPMAPPALLAVRNNEIVMRMDNGESRADLAKEFHLTPRAIALIYQNTIAQEAS